MILLINQYAKCLLPFHAVTILSSKCGRGLFDRASNKILAASARYSFISSGLQLNSSAVASTLP